jgi:hypothetical protein
MPHTPLQGNDFSDEELLDALGRVLSHQSVPHTSNAARLLEYVVRETVDGRASLLKGFSIGQDVLARISQVAG